MINNIFPFISFQQTTANRLYPKAYTLLVAGLMLSSCLTTSLQAHSEDGDDPEFGSPKQTLPQKKRGRSDSTPSKALSAAKDDEREVKRIKSRTESSLQAQNELENPALTRDARAKKAIADFTAALDLRDDNGQAVWTGQNRAGTLHNRGAAYARQSQWEPAIADYTAVLDLRDDNGNFLLGEDAKKRLLKKRAEAYRKLANQDVLKSNNIK